MPRTHLRRRRPDAPRRAAYRILHAVSGDGAYANLETARVLSDAGLDARDAAFVTELVAGTCRLQGTYDRILAAASGRDDFAADLRDALRLGVHQLLSMRVPEHALSATVDLAAAEVGERVAGLTNAVLRRVAARDLAGWVDLLAEGADPVDTLALRTHHPRWIVEAHLDLLEPAEAERALHANNVAPVPHLVVRPGLAEVSELEGTPDPWSPFGVRRPGAPGDVAAVREGRAGVQDAGSQLVAWALSRADAPGGAWLDTCAGPGGKAALLAGLARARGETLVAAELQPHRADLVRQALRAYAPHVAQVVVADGTRPPWRPGAFARVMADVPCTGLGALRRRPEARWRRAASDLDTLVPLQRALLHAALDAVAPGGVVAYVTCSPHRAETRDVVAAVTGARQDVAVEPAGPLLPGVPDATDGDFLQLWPHRHGTDAMFCAFLRRTTEGGRR